jgi:hypothetical protein
MAFSPTDTGLRRALAAAVGHSAPFTAAECRPLTGPLLIKHTRDLSELSYCPNLEHLEIFASDVASLSVLEHLPKLVTLKVDCSPVQEIEPLAHCHELTHLELNFTFVEDLSPLMALPSLRSGRLLGNPWLAVSYYELRPRLLQIPTERWGRAPVLEFSRQAEWQLTRQMWDQGIKACFSTVDGNRPVLVRPGIASVTKADCDLMAVRPEFVRLKLPALKEKTAVALFETLLRDHERSDPAHTFDFHSHRVLGNQEEAQAWVKEASLPDDIRAELLRFVNRFPSVTFYKEDDTFLDRLAASRGVQLPHWFTEIRRAIAFVVPNTAVQLQFESPDEDVGQDWYRLHLPGYANEEEKELLQSVAGLKLFPIGENSQDPAVMLAINLADANDQRVYEYNLEYLWDNAYEGRPLAEVIHVIFDSYAAMLGRIRALRLESGQVIEAGDEGRTQ